MTAATYNFVPNSEGKPFIEQGSTFDITLTCRDTDNNLVNLTGYTARMQIRANKRATTALLDMTTENGRIVLGGAAGTMQLILSATETAAFIWTKGVYDLELIAPGGNVTRLFQGAIVIDTEVTR